jgi:hypothetical protein
LSAPAVCHLSQEPSVIVQVGRRSLGQIDEMLRQATGVESLFGGLNIILVGESHSHLIPLTPT